MGSHLALAEGVHALLVKRAPDLLLCDVFDLLDSLLGVVDDVGLDPVSRGEVEPQIFILL